MRWAMISLFGTGLLLLSLRLRPQSVHCHAFTAEDRDVDIISLMSNTIVE